VAAEAEVERLVLFHHDPDNTDAEVEAIHREFQRIISARGVAVSSEPAREGAAYAV
jgi:phosphoribosyl 1,2-cyclic phosphodiesterase